MVSAATQIQHIWWNSKFWDVKMFVGTDIGTEEENLKLSMSVSNADLSAWYWDGRNLHRWIAEIAREEILKQRKDENTTAIFVG